MTGPGGGNADPKLNPPRGLFAPNNPPGAGKFPFCESRAFTPDSANPAGAALLNPVPPSPPP